MDWSNERYVRLYTRTTPDLLAFGWEGRLVWYELLRAVDRAGVLVHGGDLDQLPELLRVPPEVWSVGWPRIVARGSARLTDVAIVIPNLMPANEAAQSDRARARSSRERRRASHMGEVDVTKRDESVRPVFGASPSGAGDTSDSSEFDDAKNHEVTKRDAAETNRDRESRSATETSRPVTSCHSDAEAKAQADADADLSPADQSAEARARGRTRGKRKSAIALPESWCPGDTAIAKATELRVDLAAQVERFRNHALSHDRRCVDWDAAFLNWLSRSPEYDATRGGRTRGETGSARPRQNPAVGPVEDF